MTLQLEIVSKHRDIVGDDAVRVFNESGGTIGRSLKNDWILPDPDKYISGRHATIDYKGGTWYLADTSTNGVYVNDEREPIGRKNPRRLFNGDRLRFGDFEIVVTIDIGESLHMPAPPPVTVVPDNIEQLVPEDPLRTGVQLLDEEEITGDEDFQSALFGDSLDDLAEEPLLEAGLAALDDHLDDNLDDNDFGDDEISAMHNAVRELSSGHVTADDLFDTFLDGLGVSRADLRPDVDIVEIMQNAGEVLREFVAGNEQLLASRARLKDAFRLEQTTVLPSHNNPLKLSENTSDSIRQLLVGKAGEYLGPRDAVREISRDLLFHQDAFLGAMVVAFREFADALDPDELERQFADLAGGRLVPGFLRQHKFWSLFRDRYPIVTEQGNSGLPQLLAESFVAAYEQELAEFNRLQTGVSVPDAPRSLSLAEPANDVDIMDGATVRLVTDEAGEN